MTPADHVQPEAPHRSVSAEPLEFRAATKRYPGSPGPAVDALTLEVPAGRICVLVGPSGCGKTTAMRMVNRMIEITEGDILLGGASVRERREADLRRHIGYVIQQIGLFPHRTIAENIATVPRLLGWDRRRIAARVEELLDLIGLDAAEGRRYPAQLSGGQRQRVGVARALAVDPPLMLMDEPFGAIDPINRDRLQNEFLRLQAQLRKTVVFVTHDIDEAIKMGDRIAVMREGGRLAQYASPAELLARPADDFVRDFVGADRALKRLALQRVRDIRLHRAPLVREDGAPAAEHDGSTDIRWPLVVDDAGRPLRWAPGDGHGGGDVHVVERDDTLRDALSGLLQSDVQYGAVVHHDGTVAGIISIDLIHELVQREEPVG